jgi:hypothetical protein
MKYCARTDQAESEQNCSLQAIIGVANIEAALAAVMSRPQRMVRRNPRLQTSITEETFRSLILAAPPLSTGGLNAPTHLSTESYPHVKITTLNSVFQQPASETQLAAQSVQGVTVMVVKTEEIVCRFIGDFKVGDNGAVGKRIVIVDPGTGVVHDAEIFVGVLGCFCCAAYVAYWHTASIRCGAKVRTRSERSGHAESVGSGSI